MATGDLLLHHARVLTVDGRRPAAEAIAVRGGMIIVVGSEAECRAAAVAGAALIDCRGATVIPGIIDPHVHLLAWAAALTAVDCSAARSIEAIVELLWQAARDLPPGDWIRASGYDESLLAERRHPTRWELDRATAQHPVRLLHRSGHALVLNSAGMDRAGIRIDTEEPPGGVIDRRPEDGEPSGLLLEMNDAVTLPPLSMATLAAGMREAGQRLLAAGVTTVMDMSHTNSDRSLHLLREATEAAALPVRWRAAEGWPGAAAQLQPDDEAPIKVMVRESGGWPFPDEEDLTGIAVACRQRRRPLAVHAIGPATVAMVVRACERAGLSGPRHRIEHAAVCPPDVAARIAALGLTVVSNPAFLWHSGDRYLATMPAGELPYLYDAAGLLAAGGTVAAASDAPVTPPAPLSAMAAAVSRRTATGAQLPGDGITAAAALALHTTAAAATVGLADRVGRIAPGLAADLVIVSGQPGTAGAEVLATIAGGAIRWPADGRLLRNGFPLG